MKYGILFRWQSLWVGAHWSPYNKRLCVNLVPFITVWVTAKDSVAPNHGFDVYRNDGGKVTPPRIQEFILVNDPDRFSRVLEESQKAESP